LEKYKHCFYERKIKIPVNYDFSFLSDLDELLKRTDKAGSKTNME
jgi:hypothetical protein